MNDTKFNDLTPFLVRKLLPLLLLLLPLWDQHLEVKECSSPARAQDFSIRGAERGINESKPSQPFDSPVRLFRRERKRQSGRQSGGIRLQPAGGIIC